MRAYAAFVNGKPDVRTIRLSAPQARTAGHLWIQRRKFVVRQLKLTWRKARSS